MREGGERESRGEREEKREGGEEREVRERRKRKGREVGVVQEKGEEGMKRGERRMWVRRKKSQVKGSRKEAGREGVGVPGGGFFQDFISTYVQG